MKSRSIKNNNHMKYLILLLLSAAFLTNQNSNAQIAESTSMKPTIIFVHGLWADGSCWNKVIPSLVKQGLNVISVQNPTTSLEDDVAATRRAIKLAGGDVVLIGHSWGGFVITEAGDDPHVKALVYVAAYAPDEGETVPSVTEKAPDTKLTNFVQTTDGFLTLSKDGVTKAFANGLPSDEQNMIFCVQQPASQNVFKGVASHVAWRQKPSWYVVAADDHTINPDLERLMAERAKAKTTTVKSPHVAMLARPKEVLAVIREAVQAVSK
jgi:pimeloyl-ACP methyl ester carboxylesterase